MSQQWWITTDRLRDGGEKLMGPFGSRELAIEVRVYVEKVKKTDALWVEHEDPPAASA